MINMVKRLYLMYLSNKDSYNFFFWRSIVATSLFTESLLLAKLLEKKFFATYMFSVQSFTLLYIINLGVHSAYVYYFFKNNELSYIKKIFDYPNYLEIKTLFTQLMLERGFLTSTGIYTSFAHTDEYLNLYLQKVDEVFSIIKEAIQEDKVSKLLKGPVCHSGFRRLT